MLHNLLIALAAAAMAFGGNAGAVMLVLQLANKPEEALPGGKLAAVANSA